MLTELEHNRHCEERSSLCLTNGLVGGGTPTKGKKLLTLGSSQLHKTTLSLKCFL